MVSTVRDSRKPSKEKNRNIWIISQIFFNQIVANTELASKQLRVRACVPVNEMQFIRFRNYSPRRYSSSDAWNTQERSLKGNEKARGERRASGVRARQCARELVMRPMGMRRCSLAVGPPCSKPARGEGSRDNVSLEFTIGPVFLVTVWSFLRRRLSP